MSVWRGRLHPPKQTRARSSHALLVAFSLLALTAGTGQAQGTRPTISVPSTIAAEAAAQTPLVIGIGPPEAVPKGSFIRIRGLPATVGLSEGYSIAPGSWAIPIAGLRNLTLTLPRSPVAKTDISITLVNRDGVVLAEARSTLAVTASASGKVRRGSREPAASILRAGTPTTPEQTQPPLTSTPPPSVGRQLTAQQRERAERFLERGNEQLAQGGIAQARLLYERAAETGLPQAALALGATFDPIELQRLGVQGLKPDKAQALRWYERAHQLGAPEAEARLRRLGAN